MSALVKKLCEGQHPVEVSLRPTRNVKALKESVDRGYVLVKFTQTQGGTELGVPLDHALSDLSAADFDQERGRLKIVGPLTLDYVKVRLIADIDVASLQGQGKLELVTE